MPTSYNKPNKYDYVSRKVFDRAIDGLTRKLQVAKQEHRGDLSTLIKQILKLENELTLLHEHVRHHCIALGDEDDPIRPVDGNEELE